MYFLLYSHERLFSNFPGSIRAQLEEHSAYGIFLTSAAVLYICVENSSSVRRASGSTRELDRGVDNLSQWPRREE